MTTDAPDARESLQSPDGAPADDDRYRHLTVGDQVLRYDRLVAGAWIQEVVVALTAGSGTVLDIRESVQVHPALPEVVQRAFSGRFTHAGSEHAHDHDHCGTRPDGPPASACLTPQ